MNHDIIIAPVLSEKSATYQENERKYAFKVLKSANKIDIKKAIEDRFDVKVEKVATMNMNGKVKRSTNALCRSFQAVSAATQSSATTTRCMRTTVKGRA